MIYVQIKENNKVEHFIQNYKEHPLTKGRTEKELKEHGYFIDMPNLPKLSTGEKAYMYYYPKTDTFEFDIK